MLSLAADAGAFAALGGQDVGAAALALLSARPVTMGSLSVAYFGSGREPVVMEIGPVLDLEDVVGGKVCALASRIEPRDYADTAARAARFKCRAASCGDQRAVSVVVRASSRAMSSRAQAPKLASTLWHRWSSDRAGLAVSARASRDMPVPMSWPGCSMSPSV